MVHLTDKNPRYPSILKDIPSPPKELFIEGDLAKLLDMPRLAVIGSRKASPYGRIVTEKLVQALTAYGVVVVSGLALGIDSIAHQAAVDNDGLTMAVLPSGLDNIRPASHYTLAKQILKSGGALVSEHPPKTDCYKSNFVARSRLVSGLSQAILIIEAGEKSGCLHTANFALEQGKDVLVVPGPITSPNSVGVNNLLKTGATLIANPNDLFNALKIRTGDLGVKEVVASSPEEYTLLTLIKNGIKDGDELQVKSAMPAPDYLKVMSYLEISGKIVALGGNQWDMT